MIFIYVSILYNHPYCPCKILYIPNLEASINVENTYFLGSYSILFQIKVFWASNSNRVKQDQSGTWCGYVQNHDSRDIQPCDFQCYTISITDTLLLLCYSGIAIRFSTRTFATYVCLKHIHTHIESIFMCINMFIYFTKGILKWC